MNINAVWWDLDSLKMYEEQISKPAWVTSAKTHWHPCCQEQPSSSIQQSLDVEESSDDLEKALVTFKCPRGHEYEAPEPFIITTPDLGCNSGPVCVYCYVTWLHINIGTEELVGRG